MNYSIVIALIGFFSFIAAFYYFKRTQKTSNARDAKKDVVGLIDSINNQIIKMHFGNTIDGTLAVKRTLFEMGDLDKYKGYKPYLECQVLFAKGCNQVLDIDLFLKKPLLPKSIKDALSTFKCTDYRSIRGTVIQQKFTFAYIETIFFKETTFYRIMEDKDYKLGTAIPFQTVTSFITSCQLLEKSINDWSNKFNMNISTRYKEE